MDKEQEKIMYENNKNLLNYQVEYIEKSIEIQKNMLKEAEKLLDEAKVRKEKLIKTMKDSLET